MRHLRRAGLMLGGMLLLAGVAGFLMASVALARVRDVPEIIDSGPGRLELPADSPEVLARRKQAENVLFGSLLLGGAGIIILLVALQIPRRRPLASHDSPGAGPS